MKRKILLTSFDGLPSDKQGGPNNIIYKILNSADKRKLSYGFLSYKNSFPDSFAGNDAEIRPGIKKRITDFLYYNTQAYRFLTSSGVYLKRHFRLRDSFFEKYSPAEGFDVVHSHDALSAYYFSGACKALKILTVHGNGSIESDWADAASKNKYVKSIIPELKRREIAAFNGADIVTFPGVYAKELFLSDYKGKLNTDKDIRIVHNGIDTDSILKISPRKESLAKFGYHQGFDAVFLNVAAHVRQKNLNNIIAVIEELVKKGRNPLLINAGIGPLTDDIKSLVKKKKLQGNIKLAGKLGHEEIISLMKQADALLMMSERVIFDLVILESRACGLPVITGLEGGNKEMLEGYKGLIEIKDYSPDAVAKLIEASVYKDKIKLVKDDVFPFGIEKMIKGYEELYSGGHKR